MGRGRARSSANQPRAIPMAPIDIVGLGTALAEKVTHASGALTGNALVLGNGAGDIKVLGSLGSATLVLHGNASGPPSFGAVDLAADLTGLLPLANLTTGAAGTVLVGGGAPAWSATPAVTTLTASTALVVGASPASVGALRLGHNAFLYGRDSGSGDIPVIGVDANNYVALADSTFSNGVLLNCPWLKWGTTGAYPALLRDGPGLDIKLADNSAFTFLTASEVRVPNTGSVFARNAADSAYVQLFQLRSGDTIQMGNTAVPLKLTSNLATPGDLADGDCWVEFTGTTPARQLRIAVRDGGVIYYQNIGAAH